MNVESPDDLLRAIDRLAGSPRSNERAQLFGNLRKELTIQTQPTELDVETAMRMVLQACYIALLRSGEQRGTRERSDLYRRYQRKAVRTAERFEKVLSELNQNPIIRLIGEPRIEFREPDHVFCRHNRLRIDCDECAWLESGMAFSTSPRWRTGRPQETILDYLLEVLVGSDGENLPEDDCNTDRVLPRAGLSVARSLEFTGKVLLAVFGHAIGVESLKATWNRNRREKRAKKDL
jgi:hypothetical protein